MTNKVLVIGVSGLVGQATAERFAAAGWDVVGISRRQPGGLRDVETHSVDLLDETACRAFAANAGAVTHVVYAALQEQPGLFEGWIDDDLIERNAAMARNIFEPLLAEATGLRHVSLLHGTKAYGIHHPDLGLDGVHMPLRERQPPRPHRNFYFEQEDYLRSRRASTGGWSLTTFRPTVIYGTAEGNNMNPMLAIAAYAAILRERGEPLHFPGRHPDQLREAVAASLVAGALVWAAEAGGVDGEAYNLTNGDVFTWAGVWPAIARRLGMEVGEERPMLLHEWLPAHADEWRRLVEVDDGLDVPADITTYVGANSLIYADLVLGSLGRQATAEHPQPTIVNSTVKIRHAGFHECLDTADMFEDLVDRLVADRRLPPSRR